MELYREFVKLSSLFFSIYLVIRPSFLDFQLILMLAIGKCLTYVLPASFGTSAAVAQLDRAPDYGSGGSGFEPLRLHHFLKSPARGFFYLGATLGFYEK